MNVKLERFINGEWCFWCLYDASDEVDLKSMIRAAWEFGKNDKKVRIVRE